MARPNAAVAFLTMGGTEVVCPLRLDKDVPAFIVQLPDGGVVQIPLPSVMAIAMDVMSDPATGLEDRASIAAALGGSVAGGEREPSD